MPKSKPTPSRVHKRSGRSRCVKKMLQARWAAIAAGKESGSNIDSSRAATSDNIPEMAVETDSSHKTIRELLTGRRIVKLGHILEQYEKVVKHSTTCTMGKMCFIKETRMGMNSHLHFFCDSCEQKKIIQTDPEKDLTNAVVWGNLSIGIGQSQCEELFGIMDIPFITHKTYTRQTFHIKKNWEKKMAETMELAGKQEKSIALEKGDVMSDGTPFITVIVDGGWSKRSYGHGYNAASGVGIIIGAATKQPLFLGVRNKTCSICSYNERKNVEPTNHYCTKNYSGPSTGMEQNIIVQGFAASIEQHGVVYKYMIGDGDSSVYAKIMKLVPYGRNVVKIECANHMTKCLSSKLYKLGNTVTFPISSRRLLTRKIGSVSRIDRLVKSARVIIKNNINDTSMIRRDLKNAPYHVFGNHSNCRDIYCTKTKEEDLTKSLDGAFFREILKFMEPMVNKADRLAYNLTTNQAERYMALVAKFTGGKRVNFSQKISYVTRAYGAALSHSKGPAWHLDAWSGSIGANMSTIFKKKQQKHDNRKTRINKTNRRRNILMSGPDQHYGPNALQPDITDEEMATQKKLFINKLRERVATQEQIISIEEMTRGQHDNEYWRNLRRDYLTASNFGAVVKRRASTKCHNLVKKMLYQGDINTPGILYGRINEEVAIKKYETITGNQVKRCGMFVSDKFPFLGASPDGLLGNDGLIEVKCLSSVKGKLIDSPSRRCYKIAEDGSIKLKRNHNFFFQIQGQLAIANRQYCDFVIYADEDFHIERINRDDTVWETMAPK